MMSASRKSDEEVLRSARDSGEDPEDDEEDGIGVYMFGNKEDLKELGLEDVAVSYIATAISKDTRRPRPQKSASSKSAASSARADEGFDFNAKAATAVDYSNIDEAIEESVINLQHQQRYVHAASQVLQAARAPADDDDYDTPVAAASTARPPLPSPAPPTQPRPSIALVPLHKPAPAPVASAAPSPGPRPQVPLRAATASAPLPRPPAPVTPPMRRKQGDAPVRFSELFGPRATPLLTKRGDLAMKRRPSSHKSTALPLSLPVASDDYAQFEADGPLPQAAPRRPSLEPTVAVPASEAGAPATAVAAAASSLEGPQQAAVAVVSWEQHVQWDESEEARALAEAQEDEARRQQVELGEKSMVDGNGPTEAGPVVGSSLPAVVGRVLRRQQNAALADGSWEKAVLWSGADGPLIPAAPLVLDPNDPDMLFEERAADQLAVSAEPASPELPEEEVAPRAKYLRKLSKSGIEMAPLEARATEDEPQDLDPFNLSLDRHYPTPVRSKVHHLKGKAVIQHSEPALKLSLYKPHPIPAELENFHRPRLVLPINQPQRMLAATARDRSWLPGGNVQVEVPKTKAQLTLSHGPDPPSSRVVLIEYAEEHPPIMQLTGMGSRVLNYYRKVDPTDSCPQSFADGETVLLEPTDPSPFLGELERGRAVPALENNLFRAPLAHHPLPPTDFVLSRLPGDPPNRWVVREVNAAYAAGQQLPLQEVPAPNSRGANIFTKNRLQGYIYRLFKKKSQPRVRLGPLARAFPTQSETSVRKRLKECADHQRDETTVGYWVLKPAFTLPTEEELRQLVTPEHVATYESMLAGQLKLSQVGIDRIYSTQGLQPTIQLLEETLGAMPLVQTAKLLDEEVRLAPWNVASDLMNAMQGRGQLTLTSEAGSPFIRVSHTKQVPQKKQQAEKPKAMVTGTDADLRKLSLQEARLVLLKFGVSEEKIASLTRWDRIALVRKKSSEAAAVGDGNSITKFARGAKYSASVSLQQHKSQCQAAFDAQLSVLERQSNGGESDSEDEELVDELERELEAIRPTSRPNVLAGRKRAADADDEDEDAERREYEKLLNETNASTPTPATPTPAPSTPQLAGPRQYLKRTIVEVNPDGTTTKRVEIVKDPAKIEEILKSQQATQEGLAEALKRSGKVMLSAEEEEERLRMRRERRRLQEQLRRLRRNREKQIAMQRALLNGSTDDPIATNKLRCGTCGMIGHMRTNRNCPLYTEGQRDDDPPPPKPAVPRAPRPPAANKRKAPAAITAAAATTTPPPVPEVLVVPAPALAEPSVKIEGTKLKFNPKAIKDPAANTPVLKLKLSTPAAPPPKKPRKPRQPRQPRPPREREDRWDELEDELEDDDSDEEIDFDAIGGESGGQGGMRWEDDDPDDEIELAGAASSTRPSKTRRRQSTPVLLSNRLERLWQDLKDMPESFAFQKPVSLKEAPDYFRFVRNPMDLSKIRERVKAFQYATAEDFLADVRLMASNCHAYCDGRFPHIPPQADKLVHVAELRCAAIQAEITAAGEGVTGDAPSPVPSARAGDAPSPLPSAAVATDAGSPVPSAAAVSPLPPSSAASPPLFAMADASPPAPFVV